MATMTLIGLYNYDNSIFDNMVLPPLMDKDTLCTNILLDSAELEVIYPDPAMMKFAITNWSKKELPIWTKLFEAEKLKYNPLWNVDADISETEELERNKSGSNSNTGSSESERNNTGTDSDSGTNTAAKTGYNSSTWEDHTKDTIANTKTLNLKDTEENSISNSGEFDEDESSTITRTIRRTGNIGVTSSQELVMRQVEVAKISTMNYIIDSFKKRFCLLVY